MDIFGFSANEFMLLSLVFAGSLAAVWGASKVFFASDTVEDRLVGINSNVQQKVELRHDEEKSGWLQALGRSLSPKSEQTRTKLYEKLVQAGYRKKSALPTYYAIRVIAALGFGGGMVLLTGNLLLAVACCFFGFVMPAMILSSRAKKRVASIKKGFADALDLLLICVEAGLGFNAALIRVTKELHASHPEIAREFQVVCDEVNVGKARSEALLDFAKRLGVDEITSFATVITQSEKYGTGIADSLRVYAAEMRQKRILWLEEQAHKLPVKLSLTVAALTMPTMLLLFMTPAIFPILKFMNG